MNKGEQVRNRVGGIEIRDVFDAPPSLRSYGVMNGGLELMHLAAPQLQCKWCVGPSPPKELKDHINSRPKELSIHLLQSDPVDIIFHECGLRSRVSYTELPCIDVPFFCLPLERKPSIIFESWVASASLWAYGPVSKIASTRWEQNGYSTRCKVISATAIGGAISQDRLLVVRVLPQLLTWDWGPIERNLSPRPMSNLLDPPGFFQERHYLDHLYSSAPDSLSCPMPPKCGRLIQTPKGIRRLRPKEVCRGLGMSAPPPRVSPPVINCSTSLFHWNYLMEGLWQTPRSPQATTPLIAPAYPSPPPMQSIGSNSNPLFTWRPPDLSLGGPWYLKRIHNLEAAAKSFPDPYSVIEEGLKILSIHRNNYDADGPRPSRLQLLWWEFPPEHWSSLRRCCSMNFLTTPSSKMHANSPMTAEQQQVAASFVDELVDLHVLIPPPSDITVLATTPLFCVPKEGQPGEWRVIADMLRGGQNQSVGPDPVFLPRVTHILDSLYTGGYSAVIDASKFYHQFPTCPEDYPYLGITHPITGSTYVWAGLPMGAGNSPAMGNRFGIAFLRLLECRYPIFQGTSRDNCYWTSFRPDGTYNPDLGYGYIMTTNSGASVLVWAYVDDFLLHAPTLTACHEGLTAFLDTALDCGMLCHPKKIIPPSQEVKYCGLLVNTKSIPTLKIPVQKRERALSMIRHVLSSPTKSWSRLALAVLAGILESLSDCTPRRLGHTHLRGLHELIHSENSGPGLEPYLTCTSLTDRALQGLSWWDSHLQTSEGRLVRAGRASILVPTFGDGSGTGTGGTFHLPFQQLRMWKAAWSPAVYGFSSNYKELSTLLLTLEAILSTDPDSVRDTTLFYFTDNSCTYWICNNGSSHNDTLHSVLLEIRSIEMKLGCHLAVIHVPGRVVIQEGTDGLSRGVWLSPLHDTLPRHQLLEGVFAPLRPDSALVQHYITSHVLDFHRHHRRPFPSYLRNWKLAHWSSTWHDIPVMGHFTVWFPPPEVARQLIYFLLYRFVEAPLTTSTLLFVPRVIPGFWQNLSKYIFELPTFYPHLSDLSHPPLLSIPITVLYLPAHVRSLPVKNRLDRAPPPHRAKWHRQQAEALRWVSFVPGFLGQDS